MLSDSNMYFNMHQLVFLGVEDWFPLWKVDKDWEIQGEILLEYGIRESENMDPCFVISVIEGRCVSVL